MSRRPTGRNRSTTMKNLSPYQTAHLLVAAVRVLEYRDGHPPSPEAIGRLLSVSEEQVHRLCRKLVQQGILETTSGAYGLRVFISDHTAIEALSHEIPKSGLEDELAKFKQERQNRNKSIEELKNKEEARRKDLFKQIESRFKSKQHPPDDKASSD